MELTSSMRRAKSSSRGLALTPADNKICRFPLQFRLQINIDETCGPCKLMWAVGTTGMIVSINERKQGQNGLGTFYFI